MSNKSKIPALDAMENYRDELQLQIDSILVGKPVDKAIADSLGICLSSLDNVTTEVNNELQRVANDKKLSDLDTHEVFANCDRAHKLRQAIKICTKEGDTYWLWKLQPGEKIPQGYQKV